MNSSIVPASSNPQIFNFKSNKVRVVIIDGDPWFIASDLCKVLELGDTSKAVSRLDADEKDTTSIRTPGGMQQVLAVNEPGMYSLILGSRKEVAKEFKRWVNHEVLPSIRKTGKYELSSKEIEPMSGDAIVALAMLVRDHEREILALKEQDKSLDYRISYIEAQTGITKHDRYMTVSGYALSIYNMKIYEELSQKLGSICAEYSRVHHYIIQKAVGRNYDTNMYHLEVLSAVFEEQNGKLLHL